MYFPSSIESLPVHGLNCQPQVYYTIGKGLHLQDIVIASALIMVSAPTQKLSSVSNGLLQNLH